MPELPRSIDKIAAIRKYNARPPQKLFHYTSTEGLIGIFGQGEIWATHVKFLNDKSEMAFAIDRLKEFLTSAMKSLAPGRRDWTKLLIDELFLEFEFYLIRPLYVTAFSRQGDLLSQWDRYAPNFGYSIGFDTKQVMDSQEEPSAQLIRMCYTDYAQATLMMSVLKVYLDAAPTVSPKATHWKMRKQFVRDAGQLFRELMCYIKHEAYKEEEEWRIIARVDPQVNPDAVHLRPGAFGLVPYLKLPIRNRGKLAITSLRIGPTHYADEAETAAAISLRKYGFDYFDFDLEISEIPKRT